MKTLAHRLLLITQLALLLPVSLHAVDRFDRTKARIDALLARRLQPEPLPSAIANPFLFSGSIPDDSESTTTSTIKTVVLLSGDDEILAHYATTLKISGQMMIGGQAHLIINATPYKEGGQILVRDKGDTYYLKVLHIAPNLLTLGLNDATIDVPFKN